MFEWIDISPYWNELEKIASERDSQKRAFATSRYFNNKSHFVGLLGEKVYCLCRGTQMDISLKIKGDDGKDIQDPFLGEVEVKTSTFFSDPDLKHPVNSKHWPSIFALVVLDLENKKGALVGYTSLDKLKQKQKDYGYGSQYYMNWKDLQKFPKTKKTGQDILRIIGE